MDQPRKVAGPARGQLKREKGYSPVSVLYLYRKRCACSLGLFDYIIELLYSIAGAVTKNGIVLQQ